MIGQQNPHSFFNAAFISFLSLTGYNQLKVELLYRSKRATGVNSLNPLIPPPYSDNASLHAWLMPD